MARNFKGKTFTKILRGYAPEEVEGYIAYIDGEYKKLEKTSGDNMRKLVLALRKLDEMNNYADELERQLDEQAQGYEEQLAKQKQQIIALAKHLQKRDSAAESAEAVEKAKKDAEMIVSDAQLKAEKIIADAEELARSMREKILTEAAARAEKIINDAEESVRANPNPAEDMSLAAVDIYNEICAFRDTLFAAYNTHIESIEEITAAAEVLLADTETAVGSELSEEEPMEDEISADDGIEISDEEIIAALELEELEALEELTKEDFAEPAEEILAAFDSLVADEAEFKVIDEDETDFYGVAEEVDDGIVIDENGFIILADEEKDAEAAEEFVEPEENVETEEETEEDEIPFDVDVTDDFEVVEDESVTPEENDTYESYETYGEIDEEELDDTIDNLAQKYSQVYTDSLDDEDFEYEAEADAAGDERFDAADDDFDVEDDGSYAPDAEFAWGDDMYAEPAETEDGDFDEDSEDVFSISESKTDNYSEELDELDRLKQFFSADYDRNDAQSKSYDTASNSTTSIALSLNDFFGEGEGQYEDDFDFSEGDDVSSLFEQDEDPLSVTDEFNIIFGNSDSARNVAEINRQPIIPAEEPKNPKKHKKF